MTDRRDTQTAHGGTPDRVRTSTASTSSTSREIARARVGRSTPGPWRVIEPPYISGQVQIRDEAGELVIAALPDKGNRARCLADARLMSNAPRLVAALSAVLAFMEPDSVLDAQTDVQVRVDREHARLVAVALLAEVEL